MSIAFRLRWLSWAMALLMISPLVHAQTAKSAAREIGSPAGFRGNKPALVPGKDGAKPHKSVGPAKEIGKDGSIASELTSSKSVPWSIVVGLTLLTLLPALLLSMTPLVRLLVVFHFLRQALGTQTAPSNQVLMGLALMMTWFLMQPVLLQVEQQAVTPYQAGTISGMEALDRGVQPVKGFLLRYAREKDLALFTAAGQIPRPKTPQDLPMQVVVPAYMLSELKAGFVIGA